VKVFSSAESLLPTATAEVEAQTGVHTAPLRVLHVINRLDVGGTEYGVLKVIQGLGEELFDHRVCATRGFDPGLARRQQLDGKVCAAGRQDQRFQFPLFRLARIMKAYRPHIVHSRNWGAIEAIPAARLAGVPVVVHSEHGYELDMLGGLPGRRRLLRRALYAWADAVFTVTGELRSYHAQQAWVSCERIRVIHNGVDTRRFAPRPELRADLRQRYGLPVNGFVVGAVGRMVPIKDHATLLKAAEAMAARGADVHVVLAGTGPELERHQRYVADSALAGRVRFLGACDDIPAVLNALDVFVLPSISEGMSNTLLEAMASGLPAVATRVGGNPVLIEEDRTGWLFPPGDVPELTARLECLARHAGLRGELGAAARERAISHFSFERMIRDYRNLYLELARRRGIPAGRKA